MFYPLFSRLQANYQAEGLENIFPLKLNSYQYKNEGNGRAKTGRRGHENQVYSAWVTPETRQRKLLGIRPRMARTGKESKSGVQIYHFRLMVFRCLAEMGT